MTVRTVIPISCRGGFSAIELLIVLTIIAILMGIAAPAVVGALRSQSLHNAGMEIENAWNRASSLARARSPMPGDDRYYGVQIVQPPGGVAQVSVVYGKNDSFDVVQEGEIDKTVQLSPNVVLMVSRRSNPDNYSPLVELVWYARYGSGLPVSQTDVGVGSAPAFQLGAQTMLQAERDTIFGFRIQSVNYTEGSEQQGEAFYFSMMSNGHTTLREEYRDVD